MLSDLVTIILATIGSSLFAEAISWIMIYRTESYKNLMETIDKYSKKVEKNKDKTNNKKTARHEDTLKTASRELNFVKAKSIVAVGFTFIVLFGALTSSFDGKVVAKLPFEPFQFFRGVSHRNLIGNDYYECSFLFFYILCGMGLRGNLQKLLGTTPPKVASASFFSPPK